MTAGHRLRRFPGAGTRSAAAACCASAAIAPACSSKEESASITTPWTPPWRKLREGGFELGGHAGIEDLKLEPQRARRVHELGKLEGDAGIVGIAHCPEAARVGNDLPHQLDHLAAQIAGEIGDAGDIRSRPRQAGDQALTDGIGDPDEDDGDRRGSRAWRRSPRLWSMSG